MAEQGSCVGAHPHEVPVVPSITPVPPQTCRSSSLQKAFVKPPLNTSHRLPRRFVLLMQKVLLVQR